MGRKFHCVSKILVTFSLIIFSSCDEDPESPMVSITKFPNNKEAALSITFDDGCPSVFTKIVPAFEAIDLRASFYIIPGNIQSEQEWEKWKAVSDAGYEVGNHSLTHVSLGYISNPDVLRNEINTSHQLITEKIGRPPFSFSHPYHNTSPLADQIIFEKHFSSRMSPSGFCKIVWPDNLEQFDFELTNALASNEWIVTTAHGIGDCYRPLSEEHFVKFMETVNNQRQRFHIDTFENLAKYKIERCNTQVNIENAGSNFIVTLNDDLDDNLFNVPLTVSVNIDMTMNEVLPYSGSEIEVFTESGNTYVTLLPGSSFLISRK